MARLQKLETRKEEAQSHSSDKQENLQAVHSRGECGKETFQRMLRICEEKQMVDQAMGK